MTLIGKPSTNKTIEHTSKKPMDTIGYHKKTCVFRKNGSAIYMSEQNDNNNHYNYNNNHYNNNKYDNNNNNNKRMI